ncbi:MAG: D-aminoacyl-tRNA deacylase [Planctomycetota bacterium]
MKAVLQRVRRAQVRVDGEPVGTIGQGAVVLLGVLSGDAPDDARRLAGRIARFRYYADDEGRMNRSALDLAEAGEEVALLVVSQFTLAADGRKGRRPSFDRAAAPDVANELYELFCDALRELGVRVETGRFRAMMEVELVNDGPVTFVLEESVDGSNESRHTTEESSP